MLLIVTDINDYNLVLEKLENGSDDFEFRRSLMVKAFEHTANYDVMIAQLYEWEVQYVALESISL